MNKAVAERNRLRLIGANRLLDVEVIYEDGIYGLAVYDYAESKAPAPIKLWSSEDVERFMALMA